MYRALGDHRRAFVFAEKSLRVSEETNNRRGVMNALTELGIIYGQQNNAEQAFAHQQKALAIEEELKDTLAIAMIRHDIALQYKSFGKMDRALEIYQQLLKQLRATVIVVEWRWCAIRSAGSRPTWSNSTRRRNS